MAQDTLLGFPAHTLPYRCGEFTTLSTVSGSHPYGWEPFQYDAVMMRLNLVRLPCRMPEGRPQKKEDPLTGPQIPNRTVLAGAGTDAMAGQTPAAYFS